jgi:hypothetical protein
MQSQVAANWLIVPKLAYLCVQERIRVAARYAILQRTELKADDQAAMQHLTTLRHVPALILP